MSKNPGPAIPPIRHLWKLVTSRIQRDRYSLETHRNQLDSERNKVNEILSTLRSERDTLEFQRNQLEAERNAANFSLQQNLDNHARDFSAIQSRLDELHQRLALFGEGPPFVPNGHFYSPIHSLTEVNADLNRIYPPQRRKIPGIDLREDAQLKLLSELSPFLSDIPFKEHPNDAFRYGFVNPAYSYSDALFLHAMLRRIRPRRLIEVGSGHSSCMTLDTNEHWLDWSIKVSFIEPYPKLLHSLLKPGDVDRIDIIPKRVQEVDLELFESLEEGDVLFIDSTHVSKIGSDVNMLFFEVLPALAKGVHVHIHDIFYPFEYPRHWVLDEGRAWNEMYVLRALLQGSEKYRIDLFNTFLSQVHRHDVEKIVPMALQNEGGSIWLTKVS